MPVTLRSRSISSVAPLATPTVPSLVTSKGRNFIEVPDSDFQEFDSSRTENDIKPGQIWATYDDKDGMPRYYCRIDSVTLTPFKVQFWWLVRDDRSTEAPSTMWTRSSGYYVATGDFENGQHTSEEIVNIFSHMMHVKEQSVLGVPSRLEIYPRKGDVWAMYRDWDEALVVKSTNSSPHVCKFDMVEVLVDYTKENGVKTVKLAKMQSFRTVFQRQCGPQGAHIWGSVDLLRFSHSVPAVKIKPNRLLGIPENALELDPAAIPPGYTEPQNVSGKKPVDSQPVADVSLKQIMPVTLRSRSISSVAPLATPTVPSLVTSKGRNLIEVPDSDFQEFDSSRTENDIKPGQIWATYDDKDGMPRYYCRIDSVILTPFKVQFWWLVRDDRSTKAPSTMWTRSSGYYVATGDFENGQHTSEEIVNIFSHMMHVKEQYVLGVPSRLEIYPRKGDVWAMYRDWDEAPVVKSTNSSPHVCKFDMVEVLVDYTKENGVKTVKLAKMQSFRTVFQRQCGPQGAHIWGSVDLLRFSHSVPAVKIKPNRLLGIPKNALELDPAAIPPGYTEPQNVSGEKPVDSQPVADVKVKLKQEGNSNTPSSSRHQRPMLDGVISRFTLSQGDVASLVPETGDLVGGAEEVQQRPELEESRIPTVATTVNSTDHFSSKLDMLNSVEIVYESDFYDFSDLRTETDIEAGQIWSICDAVDKMPRIYVRVVRVLESPFQVEVWRLKLHPCSEKMQSWMDRTGLSMSCGRFKNDIPDVMRLECFSHMVLDRAKDGVNIYPRQGEVWAMFRNWDLEDSGQQGQIFGTHHTNGYDYVEILADFQVEGTLEIFRLAKVIGFKSLFQRQRQPVLKRNVGPFEFSHSIPVRRMYKDDTLRIPFGAMELDPSCIPQYFSTVAMIDPQNFSTI